MPRITVIVDTYNHERFVEQALRSVLDQDFSHSETEVIVVDDGSTDKTRAIVRGFEPYVRLISKTNGGQASAFNTAIPEATGEFVAFLDGDDWWAKDKLSAVVRAFDEHPCVAAVGHGYYEVLQDNPPSEMIVAKESCLLDLASPSAARRAILGRSLLGSSRLAVRRRVLERIGPLPANLVFCADAPILTSSLALGGAFILDRPLCFYRLHGDNLFMSSGEARTAKQRRVLEMLKFLFEYLPIQLAALGVSPETVATFKDLDRIELDRIDLEVNQGGRWQHFVSEIHNFRVSYQRPSLSYLIFKSLVAAMALILPPNRFVQARSWYTRKNLGKLRGYLAKAETATPLDLFERRSAIANEQSHA